MGDVVAYDVNGVRLVCEGEGPAGGPVVLLLHGLGEGRRSWPAVAKPLAADGWRTWAVDMRGHGDSGRPGTYAYEAMRDDVLGLIDALGQDRVVIVAHSMGTVPASLVAMDRPGAVARLVLEEGPLPFPAEPPRPVPDGPGGGSGGGPEDTDGSGGGLPAPYDWRVVRDVAVQRNAPPARHWDGLAEITAPTLVIAGGPRSHLRQDQLARTAARIPDSLLVTIDAGHMVHDERPTEFMEALRGFLGRAPGPMTAGTTTR
jgi:pimeloyl-ACP methyl ester carboxylesterase